MTSSFPVGSSVLLQNLVKGAHLNDKKGIVKTRPKHASADGSVRQEVYIFEANKSILVKPANLRYELRELSSLSIPEMKGIMVLLSDDLEDEATEWKGIDKEDLRSMVGKKIETNDPTEIAELVAKANEPKEVPSNNNSVNGAGSSGSANGLNASQLRQGAEKMAQMTPDDLQRQAATMKAMGPAALRSMNPQMARMTDAQINMAISQMEMVANNPAQMKTAMDQMKNMNENELKQAVHQSPLMSSQQPSASSMPSTASATTTPTINNVSKSQFQQATQQMSSMTPDQMRQQAAMLRSMPKDTLRRTNPQMANMSDAQIEMSIVQVEQMANNPEMMKMASEQMKNMSEADYESMKNMMGGGGGAGMGGFPAPATSTTGGATNGTDSAATAEDFQTKMMESLLSNPDQLNTMIKSMKQNPELIRSSMLQNASTDAQKQQISKAIDSFAEMDEKQLDRYLKVANGVQRVAKPALGAFKKTKDMLGISAKKLVILIILGMLAFFVGLGTWWKMRNGDEVILEDVLAEEVPEIVADYGTSEF